ncbi:MAG: hypothetical protein L3J59_01990 [Methylococcaceae bacterium]|nr:hypothetical protein [Methylococcaceae bacterium]
MKNYIFAVLIVSVTAGCGVSSGTKVIQVQNKKVDVKVKNTSDKRACVKNFIYKGSFLAGRSYTTYAFIKNISKDKAMKLAALYTVNDGWLITNSDKDLGIISASQTVNYGKGKVVPLSIGFETKNGGVKMTMTYSTSGGVTSPLESIKNHFCSTIEAVESNLR